MTVNYTTNLALGLPVTGTESGTWGDDVNNAITAYLDIAVAGGLAITITTADVTLSLTQGTSSATNIGSTTAQYAILNISGAKTAARNLIVPSSSRHYIINNAAATGGFLLTVKGAATTGVTLVDGEKALIAWNGSDYVKIASNAISNLTGTLPVANGGTGVTTSTGSGNVVLSTSPTLVTPALGTPASGVLTNATGLPLTTGVTGTLPVANGGTGVTTSTGSGNNVLSTSPTLVTPALGTPTSGTLTSCTGLPLTTGVTGTLPVANGGTGVTTSTGSGNNVLSTSPTLVTPVLGTPTSVTLTNATGLPLTTGVTGTLPIANGGTGLTTTPANGALDIGNGTGFTRTTLTAGSNITITNSAGGISIASTNPGGTVTSVGGTGTVNGITLSGTVTSTGNLTLGGTLSGVSLTTQVSGTLPVANGGTGVTTSTGSGSVVLSTSPSLTTPVLGTPTSGTLSNCTVDGTNGVGYINVPQNAQTGSYTLVASDAGKHIYHAAAAAAATYTIPANSSVAYALGTAVTFINMSTNNVTISITTDTLYLGGTGTTGSRTLAQYGVATAVKMTSTTWVITGSGLT